MKSSWFIFMALYNLILVTRGTTGCSSSSVYDEYKVVRKTDEGGKQLVIATDENAQMYCQTNVPWKKCWWKPPRNGVRQVRTNVRLGQLFVYTFFVYLELCQDMTLIHFLDAR